MKGSNRKYQVYLSQRFVSDVLHPRMLKFLGVKIPQLLLHRERLFQLQLALFVHPSSLQMRELRFLSCQGHQRDLHLGLQLRGVALQSPHLQLAHIQQVYPIPGQTMRKECRNPPRILLQFPLLLNQCAQLRIRHWKFGLEQF